MGKQTVRKSLKTIANKFPNGSPEKVYLHGKWQISRGRNPSLIYGNHKNAKQAFEGATFRVGGYLEEIRRLPYSRHWPWSTLLVEQIMNRISVQDIYKYVWSE